MKFCITRRSVHIDLTVLYFTFTLSAQMGCVTIDGVMYSMRPYVRGAISRMPYPPAVEDFDFGNDTYRLVPVELNVNLDDEHPNTPTSKSYSRPTFAWR